MIPALIYEESVKERPDNIIPFPLAKKSKVGLAPRFPDPEISSQSTALSLPYSPEEIALLVSAIKALKALGRHSIPLDAFLIQYEEKKIVMTVTDWDNLLTMLLGASFSPQLGSLSVVHQSICERFSDLIHERLRSFDNLSEADS